MFTIRMSYQGRSKEWVHRTRISWHKESKRNDTQMLNSFGGKQLLQELYEIVHILVYRYNYLWCLVKKNNRILMNGRWVVSDHCDNQNCTIIHRYIFHTFLSVIDVYLRNKVFSMSFISHNLDFAAAKSGACALVTK